jgi:hypothetical protein
MSIQFGFLNQDFCRKKIYDLIYQYSEITRWHKQILLKCNLCVEPSGFDGSAKAAVGRLVEMELLL